MWRCTPRRHSSHICRLPPAAVSQPTPPTHATSGIAPHPGACVSLGISDMDSMPGEQRYISCHLAQKETSFQCELHMI